MIKNTEFLKKVKISTFFPSFLDFSQKTHRIQIAIKKFRIDIYWVQYFALIQNFI